MSCSRMFHTIQYKKNFIFFLYTWFQPHIRCCGLLLVSCAFVYNLICFFFSHVIKQFFIFLIFKCWRLLISPLKINPSFDTEFRMNIHFRFFQNKIVSVWMEKLIDFSSLTEIKSPIGMACSLPITLIKTATMNNKQCIGTYS